LISASRDGGLRGGIGLFNLVVIVVGHQQYKDLQGFH